jgi:hypothetical protein
VCADLLLCSLCCTGGEKKTSESLVSVIPTFCCIVQCYCLARISSRAVPATVVSTRFSRHDSGLPLTFVDRFLAFSIIDSPVSIVELAFFRPRQGREYTTGIYSSGAVPATVVSTRFSRHQSGLPLTFVDRFCALCLWMCLSSRRLKYEVRGALHIYRSYLFE